MKYPNKNNSPLQNLLESEGMTRSIPGDVRREVPHSMKKGYKRILKEAGSITLGASIGTFIFFLMRKAGTWIPASKIVIPLTVATAITAGGITAVQLTSPPVETSLLVRPFQSATLSGEITGNSTKILIDHYNSAAKGFHSRISKDDKITDVPYMMIGSIEKSGGKIFLTVKLVDSSTSGILYITGKTAASEKELPVALKKLALELTGVIQKKQEAREQNK